MITLYQALAGLLVTPMLFSSQVWDERTPLQHRAAIRRPPDTVLPKGQPAPEFSLHDLNGAEVNLAGLRGNVVLLDFWATWCGPCRQELPTMEKLLDKYGNKGLIVLGVNDERPETAMSYLNRMNYSLPTLDDTVRAAHRAYHINAIPTMVLIDRDGVIAATFVGTGNDGKLEAAIERTLATVAASLLRISLLPSGDLVQAR